MVSLVGTRREIFVATSMISKERRERDSFFACQCVSIHFPSSQTIERPLFEMIQAHIQRRAVQQIFQTAGRNIGTDLGVQRHQVIRCLSALGNLPLAPTQANYFPDDIRHVRGVGYSPLGGLPLPEESNEPSGSSGFMTTMEFDLSCGEEDDDGG